MRRLVNWLRRWTVRSVLFLALVNLGWDAWSWLDRTYTTDERRFFRHAERADDIDYGIAQIRIVNATGRDFLIDSFVVDGWGGPYTHQPEADRTLAPAGEAGSSRDERRYLDHLLGHGRLLLREGPGGPTRLVSFQVDRRRPTSCEVELRIEDSREVVSECRPHHVIRESFRWLFGPPDY